MKYQWILYIAKRHFRTKRKEKGHTAALFSIAGIAVGVMTLIAVLGVMNGFQLGTIENILEINSFHLRIRNQEDNSQEIISRVTSLPKVESAVPFGEIQTICLTENSQPRGCVLRVVPQNVLKLDKGMKEHLRIVKGEFDISGDSSIVIGVELASFLRVDVGDSIILLNMQGDSFRSLQPTREVLKITGIFKTGYYDYDLSWGFISFQNSLSGGLKESSASIGIKLKNRFKDNVYISKIQKQFEEEHIEIISWREFNKAIFGALRMEKLMMMFLIGLIFLVVAANIFQSLKRSVYERTEEIGVLKAIGAHPVAVQSVFVVEGFFIGMTGAFIGTILGLYIGTHINEVFTFAEAIINGFKYLLQVVLQPYMQGTGGDYVTIFSPTYFYLTEVPSTIYLGEVIFIVLFALCSTTIAAIIASKKVAKVKPSEVLRYE